MTYKEKVQNVYPMAMAEQYRNPQKQLTHVIIWIERWPHRRLADGKNSAEAWRNAWKRIQEVAA